MEQPKKIETLKEDAVIVIKLNTHFYQRLVVVLRSIIDSKSPEELEKAGKEIESKNITEEWILNYETMLYLVKGVEEYAQANNLTEWKDIESDPSIQNTPEVSS
jgi:hypothetical protein